MPSFHPPVWFISPAEPKTYDAACISDRGVVARRTMMMTETIDVNLCKKAA